MRSLLTLLFVLGAPTAAFAQAGLCAVNPRATGFSDVVLGPDMRTVYVSGQVGVDSTGRVPADFRSQVELTFKNIGSALAKVGARFEHVVKTTIFTRDMSQLAALREVRQRYVNMAAPPASTVVEVSALANPQFLVEIEAIAVLPAPVTCPSARSGSP